VAIQERGEKTAGKKVKCTGTGECAMALVAWFGIDGRWENMSGVLNEGV